MMQEITKNTGKRIVLVLRSGGDFGFADVELLVHHILEQEPGADVYCLFDKAEKEYRLQNFTLLPLRNHWKGWWAKMNLFSPELEHLRPFLFLDLDTAVVGRLDGILPPSNQDNFICLRDFYNPQWLASGVMWIPKGGKPLQIWNHWVDNPIRHMKNYRGDQDFIRSVTKADAYWQDQVSTISSFKPKGKGWLTTVSSPIRMICFHGYPRIFEAARTVDWVNTYIKYDK